MRVGFRARALRLRIGPPSAIVRAVQMKLLGVGLFAAALTQGCTDEDFDAFVGEPEVVRYAGQPMVVDLVVELEAPGTLGAHVAADPGVAAFAPTEPAEEVRVRLRGLSPSSHQRVTLEVKSGPFAGATREVEFDTLAPLPGFVPSFESTGVASARAILFDYAVAPGMTDGSLYAVDSEGRSRFYLPTPSSSGGQDVVTRVPAGLKLLDDGRLAYVQDHRLWVVDELGEVGSSIAASDVGVEGFHHDIAPLPNGNFLVLGYEFANVSYSDAMRYVAGDVIVEITPDGRKVWHWSSFDHLDRQRLRPDFFTPFKVVHPGTQALAFDWTHGNAVVYSPEDDSILLSLRHQDWVVKISRATGDVVWRLGDEGDFQLASGRWFFHQHAPEPQPDGTLLLYDNGNGNPTLADEEERSRAVRFRLDVDVAEPVWDDAGDGYLSTIAGDANRMQSGNVLVLDSAMPLPGGGFRIYSRMREVNPDTHESPFTLRTVDDRFMFRAIPSARLPGEPRP